MNPVPSYGGNVCCTGNAITAGSFDQRKMESRHDILVYTSEPFKEGVEVSGPIMPTLYVSSDAKDTDFTVKVLDVYPDGRAYNLDESIQRMRYRDGYDKQVWMEKGKVYKVTLQPLTTSNYFAPGHRLRIEVSSSNFPRFDRNLNTGGNNYDESKGVVARNSVHHSKQYPSSITVTVVSPPAATAQATLSQHLAPGGECDERSTRISDRGLDGMAALGRSRRANRGRRGPAASGVAGETARAARRRPP